MLTLLLVTSLNIPTTEVLTLLINITAILEMILVVTRILRKVISADTKIGIFLNSLHNTSDELKDAIEEELENGGKEDSRGASGKSITNAGTSKSSNSGNDEAKRH
jgi:hypothetical protein